MNIYVHKYLFSLEYLVEERKCCNGSVDGCGLLNLIFYGPMAWIFFNFRLQASTFVNVSMSNI